MELKSKVSAVKKEKSYGHLSLNSKELPFVKNLKIGESAEFEIKVKIKGLRTPDQWEVSNEKINPKDIIASVEITGVEHKGDMKDDKD
jgi:hypothetical protein